MDSKQTLPKRKELRIKQHDYSSAGAYFVTICVKDKKPILSTLTQPVGVGALDDPFFLCKRTPHPPRSAVPLPPLGKAMLEYAQI